MLWGYHDLILEINTCVLKAGTVLSSGVFPARNPVLIQITNSRKILPAARFILPRAVFHRNGLPGNRNNCPLFSEAAPTDFGTIMSLLTPLMMVKAIPSKFPLTVEILNLLRCCNNG